MKTYIPKSKTSFNLKSFSPVGAVLFSVLVEIFTIHQISFGLSAINQVVRDWGEGMVERISRSLAGRPNIALREKERTRLQESLRRKEEDVISLVRNRFKPFCFSRPQEFHKQHTSQNTFARIQLHLAPPQQ